MPRGVGRALGARGLSGGIWTVLRMTELVTLRHDVFRALMSEVDHVVALCGWVKEMLLCNGIPEEKVTTSRQGLSEAESGSPPPATATMPTRRIRMVFVGRLDPAKGMHILIQAMRTVPEVPIDLDIYGIVQGESGAEYLRKLKHIAETDARISFRDPVPARAVVSKLRDYDVAAVPSQGLETGPMVVLEAFAAGVPVIGSNLGGIAELVTDSVDGLLVEPCSVGAWIQVLRKLSNDRTVLDKLRSGISPPRRISESARDMAEVYRALLPQEAHA
jgi:glycosyltransferase involved in cell wall biosynthesis